ncbi:MAG: hypothetical protein HY827_07520 [Actinobacteria bacterium]|nr:hypothetical protein [Actinomycetota bacterium]
MTGIADYLLLAAVVFGVNVMPAFAPPTWMALVFFNVTYDMPPYLIVPLGAVCAASGRLVLGTLAKRFRDHFSERRIAELDTLRAVAEDRRAASFGALMLFAISPVPSASLFIAAGVTGMRLGRLTLAFFSGRIVSYSIYVSASAVAAGSIESLLRRGFTSTWSLVLQLSLLALVVGLVLMPWSRLLGRFLPPASGPRAREGL